MYWGLWILRISPCKGDFECLRFSSVLETLFFTSFPMYWGLWVFTNFPSILGTLHFYEFLFALRTLSFLMYLGLWVFTNFPPILGTLNFTNLPLYRDFKFLRFPHCTGAFFKRVFSNIEDFEFLHTSHYCEDFVFLRFPLYLTLFFYEFFHVLKTLSL